MDKRFAFDVELTTAYKDDDGQMHVVAIASDSLEDRERDRMSRKAIQGMVAQAKSEEIDLLDNHKSTFGFGHTSDARLRTSKKDGKVFYQFEVDFALDDRYPHAHDLYNEVESGKVKKQLSIGGLINPRDKKTVRFEQNEAGKTVRVLDAVRLDHIATTRQGRAAVPRTQFIDAIMKSMDEGDSPAAWQHEALDEVLKTSSDATGCVVIDGVEVAYSILKKETADVEELHASEVPAPSAHATAVTFKNCLADKESSWRWTSQEADKVLGNENWSRFKRAHAWHDHAAGSVPTQKGAYKFPHHVVRGDELKTHERGVITAMGALLGARGKCEISKEEQQSVYRHLSKHYTEDLNRVAPALKGYTTEEFIEHHVEQGLDITKWWFDYLTGSINRNKATQAGTDADHISEDKGMDPITEAKVEEAASETEIDVAKSVDEGTKPATETAEVEVEVEKAAPSDKVAEGLAVLERIGKAFSPAAEVAEAPAEEVADLTKSWDTLRTSGLELTEKSFDALRRIHEGMAKLLDLDAGTRTVDSIGEEDKANPFAFKSAEEVEALVTKSVTAALAANDQGVGEEVTKVFDNTVSALVETLAKSLTQMGEGFAAQLEKQSAEIREQLERTEKSADERLGKLENVAGVSQSLPPKAVPAKTETVIAKSAPNQTTPSQKSNAFEGMFDGVKNQYMASCR